MSAFLHIDMKLSPHFYLAEFIDSDKANEQNIDNTPSVDVIKALSQTAAHLEDVRKILGDKPIKINSGYRCQALNAAVGGAANSAHLYGFAVDFVCPSYGSPFKIIQTLRKSALKFDKAINESSWVHLSFDPRSRRSVMTAVQNEHGIKFYMMGL